MSATQTYESNATLGEIGAVLGEAPSVVILTHSKPDGDAIGSTLALSRALARAGVASTVVYAGYFPDRFAGMVREGDRVVYDPDETGGAFAELGDAARIVICDTGARQQVKSALGYLEGKRERVTIVDHHLSGDADLASSLHVDPRASAACVSVASLCVTILGVPGADRLPEEVAEPLYLGLGTDTGWFRHTNTDARTLRLAADLLECGVDTDRLVRMTEFGDPPERIELLRRALNRTRLIAENTGAIMTLRALDLEEAGVTPGDTGGLVDVPRTVRSVRVVALLVEQEGGPVKVSMRSKGGEDEVDVSAIAKALGGGGHFHAAGARIDGDLDYAVHLVERLLTDALGARGDGDGA